MRDRPFSCNLDNAEVFSCVLGREEESALSIIDPVTINFEIGARDTIQQTLFHFILQKITELIHLHSI